MPMAPAGRLQDKVALVSGSGRGIGRAIAIKLASEGARVVVNDIDEAPAQEVASLIRSAGGQALVCTGDVTARDFGPRFVRVALDAFAGLDIIVNNAGYAWDATIQNTTDEQLDRMLELHLAGPLRILRAASGPIREFARAEAQQGREVFRKVVNISSLTALSGNAGQSAYTSAKAAVGGLTRTLSQEWGRYKVNVNCVAFGLIATRLAQAFGSEQATIDAGGRSIAVGVHPQLLEESLRRVPLGRMGTPQEAADAVFLFCAPESNYISGQTIACSGGLTL